MYKQFRLKITLSERVHELLKTKSTELGIPMSKVALHILLNELDPPDAVKKERVEYKTALISLLNLEFLENLADEDIEKVIRNAQKVKGMRWARQFAKERWPRRVR